MKKKYFTIYFFLVVIFLYSPFQGLTQEIQKDNTSLLQSVVKDEKGNPIKGAGIYANEGASYATTDDSGAFSMTIHSQSDLLIEADGFESRVFKPGEYKNMKELVLKVSKFFSGEKDEVNIAFNKIARRNVVGAISILNSNEFTSFDNTKWLTDVLSDGRVTGMLGSSNIRGTGTPLFIVDGLPRDISFVNFSEVDQVTVLKDINSSILYGSAAVNGVVLITTKRGQAHRKEINISGYYGVSKPKALPKYLSSADYMQLYNEARTNDGLAPLYDEASIANYRSGNKYRYPSVDYYSDEYLKSIKPYFNVNAEFSGGNDIATYYTYLDWYQTGSLLNFGAGENAKRNRFNVRGNVDLKINSWIKSAIDAVAIFDNDLTPVGNYWSSAATLRPNLFSPLIPISLIDPKNALLLGRKNDINGAYLLGGNSSYLTNPIADGYSGGNNENIQRTFSFNNRIDFDLGKLVNGLSFHTNFSFDFYTRFNQGISNTYSVYAPTWDANSDAITGLTKYNTDVKSGAQNVSNTSFNRRFGFYGTLNYDRNFNEVHHVSGSLVGYGNRYIVQDDFQGTKNTNLGLRMAYSYKEKYLADFSGAYVNSVKLPSGNRGAFSPSLGVAWVISSEDFMSSLSAINYLKLRLSAGLTNSDSGIDGFYYYDNVYGTSGSYSWYEGSWSNSGIVSNYGGNNDLGFEKRKEINFGFESILFKNKLKIDANIFASNYFDQVTKPATQYPSFYANFIPYKNFDNNAYKGAELGISYSQKIGNVTFTLGATALYADSEVKKKDEVYSNDYQYRTGHPVDAYFALQSEGFFKDENDIANHAVQAFGDVQPGDIKYVDQNKDGVVDSDDEVQIGRWQAPFSYGLNLKVVYQNFTLLALGNGRTGADNFRSGSYYWVDGDDKYSEIVWGRWSQTTQETATFPRLSSISNSNNFRNSSFWLYGSNYFRLQHVQLTYDVPTRISEFLKMKHLGFFAEGTNLFTISRNRKIMDLAVGTEPNYSSFSLGLKATF